MIYGSLCVYVVCKGRLERVTVLKIPSTDCCCNVLSYIIPNIIPRIWPGIQYPRGCTCPRLMDLGPTDHTYHGFWDLLPQQRGIQLLLNTIVSRVTLTDLALGGVKKQKQKTTQRKHNAYQNRCEPMQYHQERK